MSDETNPDRAVRSLADLLEGHEIHDSRALANLIQTWLPLDLARKLATRLIASDEDYMVLEHLEEDEKLHSIQCRPCEGCLELARQLLSELDARPGSITPEDEKDQTS